MDQPEEASEKRRWADYALDALGYFGGELPPIIAVPLVVGMIVGLPVYMLLKQKPTRFTAIVGLAAILALPCVALLAVTLPRH